MAATLLQAVQERYVAVLPTAPTLWVGGIPEGESNNLPNVSLHHGGEVPTYQQSDGDPGVTYETGTLYFAVYAVGLDAAEALAGDIKTAFSSRSLTVDGRNSAIFRRNYVVALDPFRSKEGHPVYSVRIDYESYIDGG